MSDALTTAQLGGRYRILSHLGGGGFGQTYLAEDLHLPGRPRCVVKQMQLRKTNGISLHEARRLFNAEAEALYSLGSHDQIPQLLAHFEDGEQFYLAQEYVEGCLISDEIANAAGFSEQQTFDLLQDVLRTLDFVHQHHVIHRDIKPSNLIRRQRDGKVVLIDFGSVKQVSSQPIETDGQVSITVAIGSLGYMPNEQLAGQPCLSSDIYAVGMLAIQALTGVDPKRLPKDIKTSEVVWQDLAPAISPGLANLIDLMVRYDFRQRPETAGDALAALATLGNQAAGEKTVGDGVASLSGRPVWRPVLGDAIAPDSTQANPNLALANSTNPDPAPLKSEQLALSETQTQAVETEVSMPLSDPARVWLEEGDDLFQQGRYRQAADCYGQVVDAHADYDLAWFKRAMALEGAMDAEAAIAAYDRVIQLKPNDYLAWLKRAKALETLHRFEGALAAYREVNRIQPDNYWVWHDRGKLLELLQHDDQAIAAYDRAIQLKPDFDAALTRRRDLLSRLNRVDRLYQLQHYDEAIAACDRTLASDPKDNLAWLMRGMATENLGQYLEAARAYDKVARLTPTDHFAWFRLGAMLEKLHRPHQAAIAYSQVVRLQPENIWAWLQRGQMLAQLGQREKALAAYDRALQLKPDCDSARQARQQLLQASPVTRSATVDAVAPAPVPVLSSGGVV
jgi:serine/threonine protein kinase/predicted TPR repeat methyltransferase